MSLRLKWSFMGGLAALLLSAGGAATTAHATQTPYDNGGTGTAERLVRDARKAVYHGHYTEALADDTKALSLSPNFGEAVSHRAGVYIDMGLYAQGAADLATVMAMHPDDMELGMRKVRLALIQGDPKGALAELKRAIAMPLFSHWHRPAEVGLGQDSSGTHYYVTGHMESLADEYSSIAHQMLHNDDASIMFMQNMLKVELEHPEKILAEYCYTAALAGLLESAELACQQSIEDNSHDIGQYDSLGFVHLRMKQWDKAIADYNKAINDRGDLTLSLYGRGLAKRAKGDTEGARADMEAATSGEPDIANIMKRLGAPAV